MIIGDGIVLGIGESADIKIYNGNVDHIIGARFGNDGPIKRATPVLELIPIILPEGYTRVQYIEPPALTAAHLGFGPYIKLELPYVKHGSITIDFQILDSTRRCNIFRTYPDGHPDITFFTNSYNGENTFMYVEHSSEVGDFYIHKTIANDTLRHTVYYKNMYEYDTTLRSCVLKIDETEYPMTSGWIGADTGSLYLGDLERIGTNYSYYPPRIYSCIIKDEYYETEDANLVPCINPSLQVGLYDIVRNIFFKSSDSTVQYVAGPIYPEYRVAYHYAKGINKYGTWNAGDFTASSTQTVNVDECKTYEVAL